MSRQAIFFPPFFSNRIRRNTRSNLTLPVPFFRFPFSSYSILATRITLRIRVLREGRKDHLRELDRLHEVAKNRRRHRDRLKERFLLCLGGDAPPNDPTKPSPILVPVYIATTSISREAAAQQPGETFRLSM